MSTIRCWSKSWLPSLCVVLASGSRALLGDDAIATDKHECARGMVWIGWWIDLENRRVTMAEHILLKLVFFLDQAEGYQVSGEVLEVIASLAERFSGVCPVLSFFKPYLYGAYCTLRHKEALVSVSSLVRTALALLRVLALEAWNGGGYPFDRFRPRAASTVVEFDGSIYGLGGRVFRLLPDGSEELLLELSLPLPPQVSSDSVLRVTSQNSCELLAAVVTALAAAFVLPPGNHGVRLRGDSRVALSWLSETHFKSLLSARTALAWTTLSHRLNLVITDQVHIPAEQNQVCDDYSRGTVPSSKPGVLRVAPTEDTLLDDVLRSRSWTTHVGDALFFSLRSDLEFCPQGRRILAKEVNFVTKETARALGLPPDNFSSTSHRKGGISSLFGSGATEREVLKTSTHASFTTVRHHYLFPCTRCSSPSR